MTLASLVVDSLVEILVWSSLAALVVASLASSARRAVAEKFLAVKRQR
jgi:hypothetical protein